MPATPLNKELYEKAKQIVYARYAKPSAYRSGALVKLYKEMGGKYKDDDKKKSIDDKPLKRWFEEQWSDINPSKTSTSYPVYRPTKRITEKTPTTKDELSKKRIKEQSKLKQTIKGKKNLPKF